MNQVAELSKENASLKEQLQSKDEYIRQLEEALIQTRQKQFGASSEKQSSDQLQLFNEAEQIESETLEEDPAEEASTTVQTHTRKKRSRVTILADLPREIVEYDLDPSEKVCPNDGEALKEIGSETHEQLDIIPAQVKVIRHVRKKYACPCCKQYMLTASKPNQAIEKSIASAGLLAYIATSKYCDALPLYRQSEIFKRLGIEMNRANLSNWMIRCGTLIQPLINLLKEKSLEQPVIHLDETTVQVLKEPGKAAQSKSYMWVMATQGHQPASLFHYHPSRSQSVPLDWLDGIEPGKAIMVEGYEGYQKLCNENQMHRLGCWVHARRKFVEAQKLQSKGKTGKADQGIAYIQKLYAIEKEIKDKEADERYRIRQLKAKPIVEKMKS